MKKVLIFTDTHKQTDFENSIEVTQSEANRLIDLFHNFQPWNKIKTIEDFEALCSDPLGLFNRTLQNNSGVNIQATGGKLPNPEMVAKMLDIDLPSFTLIVKGQKIEPGSCKQCNKTPKVIKQGQGVISFQTYKKYQEYLIFDKGRFSINENAVSQKKESFQVFAETPEQIKVWNHWNDLCDMLNDSAKKGYIGSDVLDKIPGLFKNRITHSYQAGKLSVDIQSLIFEIQNIKN